MRHSMPPEFIAKHGYRVPGLLVVASLHTRHALAVVRFRHLLVIVLRVVHCEANLCHTAGLFRTSPDTQGPNAECSFLHQREKDWNQNQDVNG